jgi:hypothetical protein
MDALNFPEEKDAIRDENSRFNVAEEFATKETERSIEVSPSKNWVVGPWVSTKQQLNHLYDKKNFSPKIKKANKIKIRRCSRLLILPMKPIIKDVSKKYSTEPCSLENTQTNFVNKLPPVVQSTHKTYANLINGKSNSKIENKPDRRSGSKSISVFSPAQSISRLMQCGIKYYISDLVFPKITSNKSVAKKIAKKLVKYRPSNKENKYPQADNKVDII